MPDLIPHELIPPGVNDARSRAFASALDAALAGFSTSALLIQEPMTVPAFFLPAMTVEAGLSEFVSPGMREELVRELIAAAPDIHAMTGTIAGIRRALTAVGIEVEWTQWFETTPKGHHDTHKAFLIADDTLLEGEETFSAANRAAARRLIDATKRWSQDVAIFYGFFEIGPLGIAAATHTESTIVAEPFVMGGPIEEEGALGIAAATWTETTIYIGEFAFPEPPPEGGAKYLFIF